ncbi:hypothetical protein ACG9XY_09800 [Acinetobacter seifertii]|uniref:Uncharacterized protein n=1 Tax=Acinetobacter seifertii TaxID=1530123 RepID=A0ABX8LBH7_9GAMM|nr:hypothetical protein A7P21_06350 [Acinetobacter seifertii]PTV53695.1 hypothetical protein DBL04_10670 [Acinetobacter seifertii]QNY07961.1 hypothetical protein IC769_00445 [Acinetobacter seifertii]QXB48282.1 hypothetical protein I6L30_11400 [Acinetobacter seifertii]
MLVLNLLVSAYSITNDDANAQQEFKRICSSQTVQRLKHTSLQSPVLPQDFAPNLFSSIQRFDKTEIG